MPSTHLHVPLEAIELLDTDAIHWLPNHLDREPETCHCLAHGHELPCPDCQEPSTRKDS